MSLLFEAVLMQENGSPNANSCKWNANSCKWKANSCKWKQIDANACKSCKCLQICSKWLQNIYVANDCKFLLQCYTLSTHIMLVLPVSWRYQLVSAQLRWIVQTFFLWLFSFSCRELWQFLHWLRFLSLRGRWRWCSFLLFRFFEKWSDAIVREDDYSSASSSLL